MSNINWSNTKDLVPNDANNINRKPNFLSQMINLIDDKVLEKMSPRRFIYYKKFINALDNPEGLKKFMFLLKNIETKKDSVEKKFKKIVKLHEKLSFIDTENPEYTSLKKKKLEELNNLVLKILKSKTDDLDTDKNEKDEILENMLNSFTNNKEKNEITGGGDNDYLQNFSKKIENIVSNNTINDDTKLSKYRDILNEVDTTINPTKTLDINKEDKILFIVITFIIRLISLSIVNWAINTNYINNFSNAIFLYSIIYIIILFIICSLVNISYNYTTNSILYGNTGFSFLANSLYYFYIIPGASIKRNGRLFIHCIFLLIFTIIPFSLQSSENDNNNIDYDYTKKKEAINLLSNYTLVIWIFTSIIAINY
tara:strand:- start:2970 stop:4076 length:1107 start_codon:yes stop_codon:yes gene_type:complete